MGRRSFLAGAAAVGAGVVGVPRALGASTIPRVSTRGHFDIHWWYGDYLTDGHTGTDYDTEGSIPGLDGPAGDELFVVAHGWRNDASDARSMFSTTADGLAENGYEQPVVGFTYDADTDYLEWWSATDIAERNGAKLANFLTDYAGANPGVDVRLLGHSLGARVVLSTVQELAEGGADPVASVTLLGGAANDDSVALDGQYGADIRDATGQTDNFWKSDDGILENIYSLAEADSAVGQTGAEGETPANYEDHNVDFVPDHGSYYEPGEGCMEGVVAEF